MDTGHRIQNIFIGVIISVLVIGGFWYWYSKRQISVLPQEEKSTVETAKDISEAVPEIQTNPGQKVPEVNPLDRANPFKYTNPLR